MTVHHSAEVVHTIGKSESLRICILLAHLLNTTMNITEVWIDTLDYLTIESSFKTKHTMSRRVLRANVYNIVAICKERILLLYELTVSIK